MRIDLHADTDCSDGTDSPAALVANAKAADLDVLAITDHDTAQGWSAAEAAAAQAGITLVQGMEISCRHAGSGVHLLAYLLDPSHPVMAAELEKVLDAREGRVPAVLERLRALGVDIGIDDVRRAAGATAAMGRPHVADALVTLGVVADREEAFARFLGPRAPGYVHRYAADLLAMIATVRAAGGVPVLAHPWAARHNHRALDECGLAELQGAGLCGVEVDHYDHDTEAREALRAIARSLGLVVTGSSDYHGAGKPGIELGCNTTDPDEYERLIELAGSGHHRPVL